MGQIFISAGHGGFEGGQRDLGSIVAGTTEAAELIRLRDELANELRARKLPVQSVPDDQSLQGTLEWINRRATRQDVALEIHLAAANNAATRGITAYYIANNEERRRQAAEMVGAILRYLPDLPDRGAQPDTTTGMGRLPFCRDLVPPSLQLDLGYLSNPQDRSLIQTRRRDYARGLADGLQAFLQSVSGLPTPAPTPTPTPPPIPVPNNGPSPTPAPVYPEIRIMLNGVAYPENGILVSNNSYVPIDLVDRLNLDLAQIIGRVGRVTYRGITYIRAVDLREFNIKVGWDAGTRTVALNTLTGLCPGQFDQINSSGVTTEFQLRLFLKNNNNLLLPQFEDLPRLYRQEALTEGINFDIAFAQMCLETNFLKFDNSIIRPEQNNFAGLGSVDGSAQGASFPSPQIGVRAHIQHLKAYANTAPLIQAKVDPRFDFVRRGIAPLVDLLSGRWSADPNYGTRIKAILRSLYESAGIL